MLYCHAGHTEVSRILERSLARKGRLLEAEAMRYPSGALAMRSDRLHIFHEESAFALDGEWPAVGSPSRTVQLLCQRYESRPGHAVPLQTQASFPAYAMPHSFHSFQAWSVCSSGKRHGVLFCTQSRSTELMLQHLLGAFEVTTVPDMPSTPRGILTALIKLTRL